MSVIGRRVGTAVLTAALSSAALVSTATVTAAPAGATECTSLHVVAVRGTNEPKGTAGDRLGTVVGQPVYSAIKSRVRVSTSAYDVDYPASYAQPVSVQAGNADLVRHVTSQAQRCPDQRFVLAGYSQGANVVDNSLGFSSAVARVGGAPVATLSPELTSKVVAVLLFGNPIRGIGKSITGPIKAKTFDVCVPTDPVCDPFGFNWFVHLTYGQYSIPAANFVASRL